MTIVGGTPMDASQSKANGPLMRRIVSGYWYWLVCPWPVGIDDRLKAIIIVIFALTQSAAWVHPVVPVVQAESYWYWLVFSWPVGIDDRPKVIIIVIFALAQSATWVHFVVPVEQAESTESYYRCSVTLARFAAPCALCCPGCPGCLGRKLVPFLFCQARIYLVSLLPLPWPPSGGVGAFRNFPLFCCYHVPTRIKKSDTPSLLFPLRWRDLIPRRCRIQLRISRTLVPSLMTSLC